MQKIVKLYCQMALTALALFPSAVINGQVPHRPFLSVYENPLVALDGVVFSGSHEGMKIRVEAYKDLQSNNLIFQFSLDEKMSKILVIDEGNVENFDFHSIKIHYRFRNGEHGIGIRARLGQTTDCYTNDNGKSEYTLEMSLNKVDDSYLTDRSNCRAEYSDVKYTYE